MIDLFQYASGWLVATDLPLSLSLLSYLPCMPFSLRLFPSPVPSSSTSSICVHACMFDSILSIPFRFQYKHALAVAAARIPAVPYLQLSRATSCCTAHWHCPAGAQLAGTAMIEDRFVLHAAPQATASLKLFFRAQWIYMCVCDI